MWSLGYQVPLQPQKACGGQGMVLCDSCLPLREELPGENEEARPFTGSLLFFNIYFTLPASMHLLTPTPALFTSFTLAISFKERFSFPCAK